MVFYDIHTHEVESESPKKVVSIRNLSLNEIHRNVLQTTNTYYSAGIHPWESNVASPDILNSIHSFLQSSPICVAIGEVGLDKLCKIPIEQQIKVFEQQIEVAIEFQLPIIIHCVKAWSELNTLYKKYKKSNPWIIHGFRGKKELASQLIDLGVYLSFGQYFNPETLFTIPIHRILVETDTAPTPIESIYQQLADQREIKIDVFCRFVEQNVKKVFRI